MIRIAPSVLAADFSKLAEEITRVEKGGADYLHIDIMDGHFVPNISFGPPVVYSMRRASSLIFDVHLMIENPDQYIDNFIDSGADIVTVHIEACKHIHACIQKIKKKNKRAAVALNPGTPLNALDAILPDLDMILLMTVNPGFGGQAYIESVTGKIRALRNRLKEENLKIDIEVDGGIGLDNIGKVTEAGANIIVAGTSIYNSVNIADTIRLMREKSLYKDFGR